MTLQLSTKSSGFQVAFEFFVQRRRDLDDDTSSTVREIIAAVRRDGDAALKEYTLRWDHHDLDRSGWTIEKAALREAFEGLETNLRSALELASKRIASYHARQLPRTSEYTDSEGVVLGFRWTAIESAGIYVPGGRAAYPSSVLMNAIPAVVAGVRRLVMVTPAPGGIVNPLVLAAAHIADVDELWTIGGAQAIAALAYGTARISRVDLITGPGNAWVAEAKRQVYGVVGIDMVAGPSEIVVVADDKNRADWIAADLLSQSEHDPTSQSILITDSSAFASAVMSAIERHLATLSTEAIARAAWDAHGAVIVVETLAEAPALIDALAPEHLQIATDQPRDIFDEVQHAGSVFLGRHTPEAIGDYIAGPNHVLPTGRRARFSSGLSVLNFMKRTSFIQLDEQALRAIGRPAIALAEAEGLPAHARSIAQRLDWNEEIT